MRFCIILGEVCCQDSLTLVTFRPRSSASLPLTLGLWLFPLHSYFSLFAPDLLYLLITEKNSDTNATYQQQGIKRGADKSNKQDKKARWNNDEEESGGEGSDSADSEEEITPNKTKQQNVDEKKGRSKENEFEVVPVEDNSKFKGFFRLCFSRLG